MILGVLFLSSLVSALRAAVVAKLVILGILFLTLFILALRIVLYSALYTSFLTIRYQFIT